MSENQYRAVKAAAIGALAMALVVPLVQLWPVAAALRSLFECRGNAACLPAQTLAFVGSMRHSAGAMARAMPEIAESTRGAMANSERASEATRRAAVATERLIDSTRNVVERFGPVADELATAIAETRGEAVKLLRSTDEQVVAIGGQALPVLAELATLERELRDQVREGGPRVASLVTAMEKLVADPSLTEIAANTAKATRHGGEILQTVDIATQPLRQKVSLLRRVIRVALGLVRVQVVP
jgi:hypothetical protein